MRNALFQTSIWPPSGSAPIWTGCSGASAVPDGDGDDGDGDRRQAVVAAHGPRVAAPASRRSTRVLILPGIDNSGSSHWQTMWQAVIPGCVRVIARDWERPDRAEWAAALESTLVDASVFGEACSLPAEPARQSVVLVAHSLGCLQAVHWAAAATGTQSVVRGALLVAPPDPRGAAFPKRATGFAPVPEGALPFPSMVIASSDDPFASSEFSRRYAERWGSDFVDIGPRGHINAESGLGDWPEGRAWLERLMKRG